MSFKKERSEYSPLVKVFKNGLDESDKKEGFLKRMKNIEGKNEEQLKAIKDQGEKKLDAIKKNNLLKVTKKDDKTKDIVYLSERLNKLNELDPSSFKYKSLDAPKKLVKLRKKFVLQNFIL